MIWIRASLGLSVQKDFTQLLTIVWKGWITVRWKEKQGKVSLSPGEEKKLIVFSA